MAPQHLGLMLTPVFRAFTSGGDAGKQLLVLPKPYTLGMEATLSIQVLIGDIFLVYRCFVVWGHKWWIGILPAISSLGFFICALAKIIILASPHETASLKMKLQVQLHPWIIASIATTFSTNALCTGLIAYKMLWLRGLLRGVSSAGGRSGSSTRHALVIIIESAAVYLAAMTVYLVLTVIHSTAVQAVILLIPSLIGATFAGIIIRISYGLGGSQGVSGGSSTSDSSGKSRHIRTIGGTHRLVNDSEVEMGGVNGHRPVQVYIGQVSSESRDGEPVSEWKDTVGKRM
ncbi:hypothetical protein VNI00_011003 [Paramarasmius palmivorus]|uniref:Uncharacterized protein n=1 Tax=Paramarasmius palmivorus TaxID=297713 RepID=A0AAW0CEI2_9AGAR